MNPKFSSRTSFIDLTSFVTLQILVLILVLLNPIFANLSEVCLPLYNSWYLCISGLETPVAGYAVSSVMMLHGTYAVATGAV